ncbi:MAG: cytochrome C oxidase subunit II [Alphaproteobacteria bacterium]|nr:MAG: cytochrome C oxidase subunit II [Alphaproteobacteria bacterium]
MAIHSPTNPLWWNERIGKQELIWILVAFVWGLIMFFAMIYWHIAGEQNLSNESYRIDPEVYAERVENFTTTYQVREEGDTGIPVVHPPAGSDIYMIARLWEWYPILELEKDKTYRLHLSSQDWQHGFSLQPSNINIQVHPGYELVMTITPDKAGQYSVICNEFCGIGHHNMLGRIYVTD